MLVKVFSVIAAIIGGGSLLASALFSGNDAVEPVDVKFHESIVDEVDDIEVFYGGEFQSRITAEDRVRAVVVPHHLLAGAEIAEIFWNLQKSGQHFDTVVLLGPDHFDQHKHPLHISEYHWTTPYGVLESAQLLVAKIGLHDDVRVGEDVFETEHSISTVIPFIKKHFPRASVVALTASKRTTSHHATEIGSDLATIMDDKTLIVLSMDFAHHTTTDRAQMADEESIAALSNFDIGALYALHKEVKLDNAPGAAIVIGMLQELCNCVFKSPKRNDAAQILGFMEYDDVTSYVTGFFVE